MARGDHYAVYGCSNDSNKLFCVMLEFFDSTHQKARKMLSNGRDCLTVAIIITLSTKVCSNDFKAGYRSKECPNPTLYLKGYSTDESVKRRPSPKKREVLLPKPKKRRRNNEVPQASQSGQPTCTSEDDDNDDCECIKEESLEETSSSPRPSSGDGISSRDEKTTRRNLFIKQATCQKNCFRYTGLTRPKLDLVFDLVKEKAKGLRYWKGSIDTPPSRREKRGAQPRLLSPWEELILTLVRTRKGFDVHFLADTFGISGGQVSRIYNTWITFLSSELSFLVPWPSRTDIQKVHPERFKKFKNI